MREAILRVAIAQINCIVGDLQGNSAKIKNYIQKAGQSKADMVLFPELAITGYPPEDLLIKPKFIQDNLTKLKELAVTVKEMAAVIGFVDKRGKDLYNAAAVICNHKVRGIYHKTHLPNYGVFDEKRYFRAGQSSEVFRYGEFVFGVNICEDIWYLNGPAKDQKNKGAKLIININSSPYHVGKIKERQEIICKQSRINRLPIIYVNLVGGQDELVFDGQSMAVDKSGRVIARAEAFKEQLLLLDIKVGQTVNKNQKSVIKVCDISKDRQKPSIPKASLAKPLPAVSEIYQALILGLSDYVVKNGFKKVVVGLSGGIDSALVATLAVDALGKGNVIGVFMPSFCTSGVSKIDAGKLAQNLGLKLLNVPITDIYGTYLKELKPHFSGFGKNIAEENLQARIRGNILMALSNKFGWLVLTTGNKSEMSTGYATLYGDMAGGFALIKDVPKTLVYKLARYRNSLGVVIPERVFTKAPTAELKPNQKDSDTLPEYEILDPILKAYVEEDRSSERIIALGFDQDTVLKVSGMVDKSEYKRRQSPPGVKITPKAFGRDRRMPITNKYRG